MENKFNFNSQVCTSREQSEKLLALGLKKETADMRWTQEEDGWAELQWYCRVGTFTQSDSEYFFDYIPAWSLHRLMCLVFNSGGTHVELFEDDDAYEILIYKIEMLIKEGYFNKEYLV